MADETKDPVASITDALAKQGKTIEQFKAESDERIKKAEQAIKDGDPRFASVTKDIADINTHIQSIRDEMARGKAIPEAKSGLYALCGHIALASDKNTSPAAAAKSREWLRQNGLSSGTGSDGGFTVPDDYRPELIKLVLQYGVARNAFRVVPMKSDTSSWPKLGSDVTVYYPGEQGTITASNPTFSMVELVAKKVAALTAVSSELAEDSVLEIGAIVADSMARAIAKAEDDAAFLGTGVSTYGRHVGLAGVFGAIGVGTAGAASAGVATGTGNTWAEFTLTDIRNLVGALPAEYEAGAKMYCHKKFYWSTIVRLIEAGGASYAMLRRELETAPGKSLYGYPVVFVNSMPASDANSQFCMYLGDMTRGAYFGTRRDLQIAESRDVYFTTDQIGIRATERFAINVFGAGTSSAAGPICGLVSYSS